jgi:predicted HD superfamily hydrolase involved in NAD metabolism
MKDFKEKLKELLPAYRFNHSLRVEKAAEKLAKHYGADVSKASLAGLLHDCARYKEGDALLKEAKKFGLKPDKFESLQPKLIHARLSAVVARKKFGVSDKSVLSAISKHTVGSEKMTLLEKVIYLADHIEGGRKFKGVSKLRGLAFRDMDKAIAESTGSMLLSLVRKGLLISEQTVRTRNYYLKRKNG